MEKRGNHRWRKGDGTYRNGERKERKDRREGREHRKTTNIVEKRKQGNRKTYTYSTGGRR